MVTAGVTEHQALRVVALVASTGGLAALGEVVGALPAAFPAAVLIVLHLSAAHPSNLAHILGKRTALRVKQATAGARPRAGVVYVGVPGYHLVARPSGALGLSRVPAVNFVRPSADVLFASLADVYGSQTIAVVLTGLGRDGADGVRKIKARGGIVIAQDETTSAAFGMPSAAIRTGVVDTILPLDQIAPALVRLLRGRNA